MTGNDLVQQLMQAGGERAMAKPLFIRDRSGLLIPMDKLATPSIRDLGNDVILDCQPDDPRCSGFVYALVGR